MKKKRKKRALKFITLFIFFTALALLSVHAFIDLFEKEIAGFITKKIEKNLKKEYSITYDHIDLDFFSRSIRIKNLSINPDKKIFAGNSAKTEPAKNNKWYVKAALPVLHIQGLSIFRLVLGKSLAIDQLSLKGGELILVKNRKMKSANIAKAKSKSAGNKDKKKSTSIIPLYIKLLKIDNISFQLVEPGKKNPVLHIPALSVMLSRFKIHPARGVKGKEKKPQPGIRFSFKFGEYRLTEPAFILHRGFYTLKAREIKISKLNASASFHGLQLIPRYEKEQFAKLMGYRTSRHSLNIDRVTLENIHFDEFFIDQQFHTGSITIENPVLDIFRDKNIPPRPVPRKKKFPQELLKKLKIKLKIDHIKISNGTIAYAERAEKEKYPGKMFFSGIRASLKNVTNYPGLLKKKVSLLLTASTRVMGKSPLTVNISIPLNDKKNSFRFYGTLGKTEGKLFNSILKRNAHIRIDSGVVHEMRFKATADNDRAKGEMKCLYKNLKISVLKKVGRQKKRRIFSFLANTVIYRHNPSRGKAVRIGKILFKREKPVSFFSYMWKALLSGIKSSIGLNIN